MVRMILHSSSESHDGERFEEMSTNTPCVAGTMLLCSLISWEHGEGSSPDEVIMQEKYDDLRTLSLPSVDSDANVLVGGSVKPCLVGLGMSICLLIALNRGETKGGSRRSDRCKLPVLSSSVTEKATSILSYGSGMNMPRFPRSPLLTMMPSRRGSKDWLLVSWGKSSVAGIDSIYVTNEAQNMDGNEKVTKVVWSAFKPCIFTGFELFCVLITAIGDSLTMLTVSKSLGAAI